MFECICVTLLLDQGLPAFFLTRLLDIPYVRTDSKCLLELSFSF